MQSGTRMSADALLSARGLRMSTLLARTLGNTWQSGMRMLAMLPRRSTHGSTLIAVYKPLFLRKVKPP